MLSHVSGFPSFLKAGYISLCVYDTFHFSIPLSVDTWVAVTLGLLCCDELLLPLLSGYTQKWIHSQL